MSTGNAPVDRADEVIGGCMPAPRSQWIAARPQNRPKLLELYDSPEDVDTACQADLTGCRESGEPALWTELALHLGLDSRQTLWEYVTGHTEGLPQEWRLPLQRALTGVEAGYERRLHGTTPTGAIFALKQRGWVEQVTIESPALDSALDGLRTLFGRVGQRAIEGTAEAIDGP